MVQNLFPLNLSSTNFFLLPCLKQEEEIIDKSTKMLNSIPVLIYQMAFKKWKRRFQWELFQQLTIKYLWTKSPNFLIIPCKISEDCASTYIKQDLTKDTVFARYCGWARSICDQSDASNGCAHMFEKNFSRAKDLASYYAQVAVPTRLCKL